MNLNLKNFLTDAHVKNLINNNAWDEIYKIIMENFRTFKGNIGYFTLMLLNSGIDPLKHLGYIPAFYLSRLNEMDVYNAKISINTLIVPDTIKEIKMGAFLGNKCIQKVILPKSINYIDMGAFRECSNLVKINYKGTMEDWKKITLEDEGTFAGIATNTIECLDGQISI